MRRIILAALVLIASPILIAQSPAPAKFEVASIKLDPNQSHGAPRKLDEITLSVVRVLPGGRIESYGQTLRNLIAWAYEVNTQYQRIDGKQDILDSEFVIAAKAATPTLTSAETRPMVRTLLEERLQLLWHRQPRDIDTYALVPARDDGRPSPGLRTFTGDCEARATNPAVRFDDPNYEQQTRCGWTGISERQRAVGVSMKAVADRLAIQMGTPVTDRTAWPGLFTFDVTATTRDMPGEQALMRAASARLGAALPTDAPQLLDVFKSDLGLKLVKERTTTTDFVIERVGPLIED